MFWEAWQILDLCAFLAIWRFLDFDSWLDWMGWQHENFFLAINNSHYLYCLNYLMNLNLISFYYHYHHHCWRCHRNQNQFQNQDQFQNHWHVCKNYLHCYFSLLWLYGLDWPPETRSGTGDKEGPRVSPLECCQEATKKNNFRVYLLWHPE